MPVSPKFKRELIRLEDRDKRVGILLHAGNTKGDSDGCILVGTLDSKDKPTKLKVGSRNTETDLMEKVKGKKVTVIVESSL